LAAIVFILTQRTAQAQDSGSPALPRNNFGSVGMIDMPSARFAPDGELSVGASFFKNTQHYNLGFQILPWLEGSFRYSGLQHFDPAYPVYYDRSFAVKLRLWDESDLWPAVAVGVNDLVGTGAYSGEYLVASKQFGPVDATLGIGWGRLGSTALFRNPLTRISKSFTGRTQFPNIVPGTTAFDTLFHGPSSGLFGGIIYHTPLSGLSLIGEYSSDNYLLESSRGNFNPRSQFSYGASYQLTDAMTLGMSWLYDRSVNGSISFQLDPVHPQYPQKIEPPGTPEQVRTPEQQQKGLEALLQKNAPAARLIPAKMAEKNSFVDAIWNQGDITDVSMRGNTVAISSNRASSTAQCQRLAARSALDNAVDTLVITGPAGRISCSVPHLVHIEAPTFFSDIRVSAIDLAGDPLVIDASSVEAEQKQARHTILAYVSKQNIHIEVLAFGPGSVTIYFTNSHYFAEADAIDRLVRILMADAPAEIEEFRLIAVRSGIPQREFDVMRAPAERNSLAGEGLKLFEGPLSQKPAPMSNPILTAAESKNYPSFAWDIFPQFRQQLFDPNNPFGVQILGAGFVSLSLLPGLSLNGEGELSIFDNFDVNRQSDSLLPHVRTDFVRYFTEGKNGIGLLNAEYQFRASPTVFGIVQAGILESMYDGVGGELLWRPEGARWGIGVDAYEVWQRDFDRLFGLRPYHAFTGHISLYYQSPWYKLNFALRAGQYLAGDRGLTFEVTRRFSTGVEIGAFATKTNVSSAQFGEGSFDKGIIIRIPLSWVAPIETQAILPLDLRPLQRDGGQRLAGDASLWERTRRSSEGEILNTLEQ
jgi:hypothetical protein